MNCVNSSHVSCVPYIFLQWSHASYLQSRRLPIRQGLPSVFLRTPQSLLATSFSTLRYVLIFLCPSHPPRFPLSFTLFLSSPLLPLSPSFCLPRDSNIWMSRVSHVPFSEWVVSHIWTSRMWMSYVTYMNESHVNELCHIYERVACEWVMSHLWTSVNELCHMYERVTCEWVMGEVIFCHTHVNHSRHNDLYEWFTSLLSPHQKLLWGGFWTPVHPFCLICTTNPNKTGILD